MSEPSGRYQSRILNFVARQTQKFTDRTATVLRQLKVTTIWSTQILLYPVYALFQTARLVGRQLRQTAHSIQQRLRAAPPVEPSAPDLPAVDAPIQQVLAAIGQSDMRSQFSVGPTSLLSTPDRAAAEMGGELVMIGQESALLLGRSAGIGDPAAGLGDELAGKDGTSAGRRDESPSLRGALRGVACLLDGRRLVLVTDDNQLLDILTLDQQQQLQRQIILAIASYWYAWRCRTIGTTSPPLPPPRDRSTAWLPVRLFGQLMAWMQTGPIATTTNLFQEAAWAIAPAELDWFTPALTPTPGAIAWSLPQWPTPQGWQTLAQQVPPPNELPDLIRAAIWYFLGRSPRVLPPPPSPDLPPPKAAGELRSAPRFLLRPVLSPPTEDPWLTLTEVGDRRPRVVGKGHPAGQREEISPRALPARPARRWGDRWRHWLQHYGWPPLPAPLSPLPPPPSPLPELEPPSSFGLNKVSRPTPAPPPPETVGPPSRPPAASANAAGTPTALAESWGKVDQGSAAIARVSPTLAAPESDPEDWIETPATAVGYVKHPLAQVLAWVDYILLWCENRLLALWDRLGRLLR